MSGAFDRSHLNAPEPIGYVTCDCNTVQPPKRTNSNKNGNEGRWYYNCDHCGAYKFADDLPGYPNVGEVSIRGKRHQERTQAARQLGARAAAEMNYGASQAAGPAAAAPQTPVQAPPPAAAAAHGTPVKFRLEDLGPAANGQRQKGLLITVPIPGDATVTAMQAAADAAYHAAQLVLTASLTSTSAAAAAAAAAAASGPSSSRPQNGAGGSQLPAYREAMGTPGGSNPGYDRQGMAPQAQRRLEYPNSPAGLLSQASGSGSGSQPHHSQNGMGSQQQQLMSQGSQPGLLPGGSSQQVQQQQWQHGQLVRVRVPVFNEPEDPQGLLLFTGAYNEAVKQVMNTHGAQWYKEIKRWKIFRNQYQQVKQELEVIGYDMADEPRGSAAGGD